MSRFIVPTPRYDEPYRNELLGVIQHGIDKHERSAQVEVGPSGVGGCERKVAFQLAYGANSDGEGGWSAHKGTVMHKWLEETFSVAERYMPDGSARFMTEVALESSTPGVISGGTCDLYDRLYQRVVDWKCPGGFTMDKIRSGDWSESYYKQAQVYGYHLSLMGYPVMTTALAFLPIASSQLHDTRTGAVLAYWDYDQQVAIDAIANLSRIRNLLDLAPASKVIDAMNTRSDFCTSCPAHVSSSDRRGTCQGAVPVIPPRNSNNPFS